MIISCSSFFFFYANASFSQTYVSGEIIYHLSSVDINGSEYPASVMIVTLGNLTDNENGVFQEMNIKILKGNESFIDNIYFINIDTRCVYTKGGEYIGKTIFFIPTPLSTGNEDLYAINYSYFSKYGYKTYPITVDVVDIDRSAVNTIQGVQDAYEININYTFISVTNIGNRMFRGGDVLIYDYDRGVLISWPTPLLSPALLSIGVDDIEYTDQYMSKINILIDLGKPIYPKWMIIILRYQGFIILIIAILIIIFLIVWKKYYGKR